MLLRNLSSLNLKSSSFSISFSSSLSPETTRLSQYVTVKDEVKITSSLSPHMCILSSDFDFYAPTPSTSVEVPVDSCVGDGGHGGKICSGGGNRGSSGSDPNERMDAYYQKMIESDPSNPLIIGNYVKFLKEVQLDLAKAEEYCERAILVNQEDGDILSMYADLIWERSRDAERAETYFDRAVQASPRDCAIAASYARFLWEADNTDDDQECRIGIEEKARISWTSYPSKAAAL